MNHITPPGAHVLLCLFNSITVRFLSEDNLISLICFRFVWTHAALKEDTKMLNRKSVWWCEQSLSSVIFHLYAYLMRADKAITARQRRQTGMN